MRGHNEILAEHLLLGVMADVSGIGARVLRGLGVQHDAEALSSLGIDLDAVRRKAEATFGPGALDRPSARRARAFTAAAKAALEQALREALALQHNYIGAEHILLGLVLDDRGPVAVTLRQLGLGIDHGEVRARVLDELGRAA